MRILITGGAGFIGSKVSLLLQAQGHDVVILDSLSPQVHGPDALWPDQLVGCPGMHLVRGNVEDPAAVERCLEGCDAVVHLAAETGTGQSMYQIHHYSQVNIDATANLLEAIAIRHKQVRKIVFASSRSIYGEGSYQGQDGQIFTPSSRTKGSLEMGIWDQVGPDGIPLNPVPTREDAGISPSSVYAATKVAAELLGRIVADNFGIGFEALRFQNVYGEGQSLVNPYTGILSIFSNLMRQDRVINIFEDGLESRDFIHVDDVATAVSLALTSPSSSFRALNIGSGQPTSVLKIAEILGTALNSHSKLVITGDYRAGDIRHCFADTTAARSALGFNAAVSIEDGLRRFCEWVVTQEIVESHASQAQQLLQKLGLGKVSLES